LKALAPPAPQFADRPSKGWLGMWSLTRIHDMYLNNARLLP
jgi:hypothetical protein